jgi:serine/threonine protein kinase
MLWTEAWLILVMLKLVLARYDYSQYAWSTEDDSTDDSPIRLNKSTANWRSKSQLKRAANKREDAFIRSVCNPEDPTLLYEIQEEIGSGAFGKVYRGRRRSDGKQVAIKTIAMNQHPDMLVRELRALEIVRKAPGRPRNLPLMYAAYKDVTDAKARLRSNEPNRKRLWIVMEFIKGMTIPNSIRSGGLFEIQQVKTIMRQVMDSICFLHNDHRLIHGDLIPQNVILNNRSDLEVKLVDFGLSRMIGESERRTVGWELSKAGAMAYRLRFGDMPNSRGGERMNLAQLCASSHLTTKIPSDMLSFMNACLGINAQACQLKDHAFLRNSSGQTKKPYYMETEDDHYDIEASWYGRLVGKELYR